MQPSPWAGTVRLPSVRVRMRSSCPDRTRSNPPGTASLGQGRQSCRSVAIPLRSPMFQRASRTHRRLLGAVSGAVVLGAVLATPADAAAPAPVQAFLAHQLSTLAAATPTTVLVHGTDAAAARSAVAATGMRTITEFARIGVVVASGTRDQIESARTR